MSQKVRNHFQDQLDTLDLKVLNPNVDERLELIPQLAKAFFEELRHKKEFNIRNIQGLSILQFRFKELNSKLDEFFSNIPKQVKELYLKGLKEALDHSSAGNKRVALGKSKQNLEWQEKLKSNSFLELTIHRIEQKTKQELEKHLPERLSKNPILTPSLISDSTRLALRDSIIESVLEDFQGEFSKDLTSFEKLNDTYKQNGFESLFSTLPVFEVIPNSKFIKPYIHKYVSIGEYIILVKNPEK